MDPEDHLQWVNRGRQRRVVALVLAKPMTPTEIKEAAMPETPQLQLRDLWLILRQYQQRGLVECLTPAALIGKVYAPTDSGRRLIGQLTGRTPPETPEKVDWVRYSLVVRARSRKAVTLELAKPFGFGTPGKTAKTIRDALRTREQFGLNSIIRALNDLCAFRLARCISITPKRKRKVYGLTSSGKRIAEWIKLPDTVGHEHRTEWRQGISSQEP